MDFLIPDLINPERWSDLQFTLVWLWCFVGSMILFAGNLLIAHGIIPSLTSTRDLPARFSSIRPVLYGASGLFLILAIFCFAQFSTYLDSIYDIYPRMWI